MIPGTLSGAVTGLYHRNRYEGNLLQGMQKNTAGRQKLFAIYVFFCV